MRATRPALLALSALALSACGSGSSSARTAASATNPHRLPLGDGHVSTRPRRGYVYACHTRFPGGPPATSTPWIRSDGTWDATAKPHVAGDVRWRAARLSLLFSGSALRV